MSRWSRSAAQGFIKQRSAKQIEDAKVLHDAEMVKLKAPELWAIYAEEFEQKCAEFNSEPEMGSVLSVQRRGPCKLRIVRKDTEAALTITFMPSLALVTVEGAECPLRFRFEVINSTSDVGLFLTKAGRRQDGALSLEEFVSTVLDMFLEG